MCKTKTSAPFLLFSLLVLIYFIQICSYFNICIKEGRSLSRSIFIIEYRRFISKIYYEPPTVYTLKEISSIEASPT